MLWDGFIAVASLQGIGNAFEERDIGLFDSRITIPDFMLYLALALVHLNRNELYEGDNPLQIFSKITQKPETVL